MTIDEHAIAIAGVEHYIARAPGPAVAGVLLLPTVNGIDDFARRFADDLAANGYTTIVWNPYPGVSSGAPEDVRAHANRLKDDDTVARLSACVDVMEGALGLERLSTIGFCLGGRFALLFGAREPRLHAVISVYPTVPAERRPHQDIDPISAAAEIECPVQLLYPDRDHITSRATFEALQAALQSRTAATAVLHYPEAGHGFMHNPGPANEAATLSARPQIVAFLGAHTAGAH